MPELAEPAPTDVEEFSIDQMASAASAPEPKAEPEAKAPEPKPEAKTEPAKVESKKPEVKTPEAKPEAKKEAPKKEDGDDYKNTPHYKNANAELRKILDKVAKERDEFKTKVTTLSPLEQKVAEYEKKIAEIQAKPVETKTDTALLESYESKLKAAEARVREMDYSKSQEFQDKFIAPLNKRYQKALSQITQLTVTEGDQSRQATQGDFDLIRNMPFGQQRAAARQMFGQDSDLILSHINAISEIQESAREAIENEKVNGETRQKELSAKQQREQSEYKQLLKQSEESIRAEFDTFKFSDDPKEQEIFDNGIAFAEEALNNASLPLDKRAAISAAFKMKAVGFDIERSRRIALQEQVTSLTEELAKFRESDPGNGGEKATPAPELDDEPTSIEDLIAKAPGTWKG